MQYKAEERGNTSVLIVILALLYFAFGKLSFFFLSDNYFITIGVFASEGIALAFALYFGKRVIPGIFLGQFALAFSNGLDIGASGAIGVVNSIEALLGIWLLTKFRFDPRLQTFRDFGLLFGVIVLVLQPFSGFVSNAYLIYNGDIPVGDYMSSSLDWIIGNIVGQFLFTPFFIDVVYTLSEDRPITLFSFWLDNDYFFLPVGYCYQDRESLSTV